MSDVYLMFEGAPTDASTLFWGVFARCGCLDGAMTIDRGKGDVLVTAEQARSDMNDGVKVLIDRSVEDGETVRLMSREEYRSLTMGCDHDPKWGVPVVAAPDGQVWATGDLWHRGRKTYRRHLVSADCLRDARLHPQPAALCGATASYGWSADRDDLHDTVTCRKCEAAVTP